MGTGFEAGIHIEEEDSVRTGPETRVFLRAL